MSLSFTQINASLCTPTGTPYSLRAMSAAAGFSTPDAVSEFIGYICPTPTLCTYYQTYDYGYVLYYDCAGNSQYYYVGPSQYLCVSSFDGGPAFDTGAACV